MTANDVTSLLNAIDQQVNYLRATRAFFPYMSEAPLGKSSFRTPPFYSHHGFDIEFHLDEPLTQERLNHIRSVGHWHNQNFVIRLHALLEAHGIIPSEEEGRIDQDIEKWYDVELVRRLRHQFAHSRGKYDRDDPKQKKLYEKVVECFEVDEAQPSDAATEYPLSIDMVLIPLAEGCKKYIAAKSAGSPRSTHDTGRS